MTYKVLNAALLLPFVLCAFSVAIGLTMAVGGAFALGRPLVSLGGVGLVLVSTALALALERVAA